MALIDFKGLITAVLNQLKADTTTKGINWHYGFTPLEMIQDFDRGAGCVTALFASDIPVDIPKGRQIPTELGLVLYAKGNKGPEFVEKDLQVMVDNVLQALASNRNFGLPRVVLSKVPRLEFGTNASKEAQIAWCLIHLECLVQI